MVKNTVSLLFVISVSDHVVIELVKKQVQQYEKDNVSWIIEGFPRTKA
jgi:adenylate kinase family enzyme